MIKRMNKIKKVMKRNLMIFLKRFRKKLRSDRKLRKVKKLSTNIMQVIDIHVHVITILQNGPLTKKTDFYGIGYKPTE